jgi:HSP20 family protein
MRMIPYTRGRLARVHPWPEFEPGFSDLIRSFWGEGESEALWTPQMDVHENKDAYTVRLDLPGLDKKDIQVSVEDSVLTVRGQRRGQSEDKDEKGTWHRIERYSGSFERSLRLGAGVDASAVKADYKDGVLSVRIPKKVAAKPKTINNG